MCRGSGESELDSRRPGPAILRLRNEGTSFKQETHLELFCSLFSGPVNLRAFAFEHARLQAYADHRHLASSQRVCEPAKSTHRSWPYVTLCLVLPCLTFAAAAAAAACLAKLTLGRLGGTILRPRSFYFPGAWLASCLLAFAHHGRHGRACIGSTWLGRIKRIVRPAASIWRKIPSPALSSQLDQAIVTLADVLRKKVVHCEATSP